MSIYFGITLDMYSMYIPGGWISDGRGQEPCIPEPDQLILQLLVGMICSTKFKG